MIKMKRFKKRRSGVKKAKGSIIAAIVMLSMVILITPVLSKFSGAFATAITGITLPDGGKQLLFEHLYSPSSASEPKSNYDSGNDLPEIKSSSPVKAFAGSATLKQIELKDAPDISEARRGNILNMTVGHTGSNYGNVWIKNTTGRNIDIKSLINSSPYITPFKLNDPNEPVVLIYHTHSTESFLEYDGEYYDTKWSGRSDDSEKNIMAVGEMIAEQLRAAGIGVIHDTEIYDSPVFKGAYTRSGDAEDAYMQKYPSIQVALDIHRDSMVRKDKTSIRPTVEIDGKKAAQIMILAGCEAEGSLNHPDWEYNLIFAVNLQNIIEEKYAGLTRPLDFMVSRYNQQKCRNGLLIEMGTEANTVNEALYSGWLVGDCLAELLSQYNE